MRILITGGSGLLGKSLLETAPKEHELALTYKKNRPETAKNVILYGLDVQNRSDVCDIFEVFRPNVVIHCAAIGSVDHTEDHYLETRNVNVTGLGHVVDMANGYKAKVIYISTNAVYDGNKPPYGEKSSLEPVNSYGIIKREAESLVQDTANKWLIFRPFMLYGWPYAGGRTNWAVKIVTVLGNRGGLKLVNDVVWMPTYAPDCARVIWQLLNEHNQVFNVASPERATLYEFGLKVCDVFGLEKNLISPVETNFFYNIAKRPKDTTYSLDKLHGLGFILSDIKTGLEKMKEAQE
jgi:dTDP-4-dehydrorhamnose reductase